MRDTSDAQVHAAVDLAASGVVNPRAAERALNAFWSLSETMYGNSHISEEAREARNEGIARCGERLLWFFTAADWLREFDTAQAEMEDGTTIGKTLVNLLERGWSTDRVGEMLRALQFRARRRSTGEPLTGDRKAKELLKQKGVRVGSPPFVLTQGQHVLTWVQYAIKAEKIRLYKTSERRNQAVDVEEAEVEQMVFEQPDKAAEESELVEFTRAKLSKLPAKRTERRRRLAVLFRFGIHMPSEANNSSEYMNWIRSLADDSGLPWQEIKQIKRKSRNASGAANAEGLPATTIAMLFGISESHARKLIRTGCQELANVCKR